MSLTEHEKSMTGDKPTVSANFWRGLGNGLIFALVLWAILALAWLA